MLAGAEERRRDSWLQTVWLAAVICNASGRLRFPMRVDRIMRQLGFSFGPATADPDAGRSIGEKLANLENDVGKGVWAVRGGGSP